MAETEKKPDQEQLKKQARRRLVGASAFALFAAVVLPIVMDKTPQPTVHDIDVRIPGQEDKPAVLPPVIPPAASPATVSPALPGANAAVTSGNPEGVPAAVPAAATPPAATPFNPMQAAPGTLPAAPPPAALPPAPLPAATGGATPSLGASAGRMTAPAAPPLPPDVLPAATPRPAAKENKAREASKPEKDKADRDNEKNTEKNSEKDKARKEKDSKESRGEADRAAAILSGKAEKTDKNKDKAGDGNFVIMLGSFSNEANARNLHDRLAAQGIRTYSENLNTPQGTKVRVRVGPFNDRDKAEKVLEKLRGQGISGAIAGK